MSPTHVQICRNQMFENLLHGWFKDWLKLLIYHLNDGEKLSFNEKSKNVFKDHFTDKFIYKWNEIQIDWIWSHLHSLIVIEA